MQYDILPKPGLEPEMTCTDCEARQKAARDAFVNWHIAEAVKQLGLGAAEMIGLKDKPNGNEIRSIRGSMDAGNGSADVGGISEGGSTPSG